MTTLISDENGTSAARAGGKTPKANGTVKKSRYGNSALKLRPRLKSEISPTARFTSTKRSITVAENSPG